MTLRWSVVAVSLAVTACAAKHDLLVTPDEDYAQGTDVTVRVEEISNATQRTKVRLTVANRLPDPLVVSEMHASLLDADERAVPLLRINGSDVCSGCTRSIDLVFETKSATAGVGELQLTGLPVEVGPILLRMGGREEPTEPVNGWDVAEKVIGYTVGAILLLGLLTLCILAGGGCDFRADPLGRAIRGTGCDCD